MESPVTEELLEDDISLRPILDKDIERILNEIIAADEKSGWEAGIEVDLGARVWRPSGVSSKRDALLYICMQDQIPRHALTRLRLALEQNLGIVIALPLSSLFKADVLKALVGLDCDVMVIDDFRKDRRFEKRHYVAAIADIEVPLAPNDRQTVGRAVWSRIGEGTPQERGKRLEALLAFIFSQVSDLKVVERNYRNETEEIDLVLQIDNFSPRVWQSPGKPFVLVEAKNRQEKATQQMVSVLIAKLQTKRGTTKLGVLVSPAGFTEDARSQELRFSTQDLCVVMIDRAGIDALIEAEDLDAELEDMVRHALLR